MHTRRHKHLLACLAKQGRTWPIGLGLRSLTASSSSLDYLQHSQQALLADSQDSPLEAK